MSATASFSTFVRCSGLAIARSMRQYSHSLAVTRDEVSKERIWNRTVCLLFKVYSSQSVSTKDIVCLCRASRSKATHTAFVCTVTLTSLSRIRCRREATTEARQPLHHIRFSSHHPSGFRQEPQVVLVFVAVDRFLVLDKLAQPNIGYWEHPFFPGRASPASPPTMR